jgi:spore coat polysaccharide biosynthesis protein SpsF
MNIAAIIQARTGSTRLPNKVFLDLEGKPLIWHVFDRIKESKFINQFILATTDNKNDQELETWALNNKLSIYRGSEDDVLDRYYQAAKLFEADIIVRITADDPLKDVTVVDEVIYELLKNNVDFTFNNNPVSYPEGMDVEVFKFKALEIANNKSVDPFEREHVTQFFHRNTLIFTTKNISYYKNLSHLRFTIDTLQDYKFARLIYKRLYNFNKRFEFQDVLKLIESNPEFAYINNNEKRSEMYKNKNI